MILFILWLLFFAGVLAIAWLFAGITVPQRMESHD